MLLIGLRMRNYIVFVCMPFCMTTRGWVRFYTGYLVRQEPLGPARVLSKSMLGRILCKNIPITGSSLGFCKADPEISASQVIYSLCIVVHQVKNKKEKDSRSTYLSACPVCSITSAQTWQLTLMGTRMTTVSVGANLAWQPSAAVCTEGGIACRTSV